MAHYKPPKGKGKVSPLDPGTQVEKKKKADAKAAKKAADAKAAKRAAAAKKPPASKTVVKKTPPKSKAPAPNVKGPGVLGMSATAARAIPYIGAAGVAAFGITKAVAPVFRHLFPKSEPWKLTPKLEASQRRMNKAMRGPQGPWSDIMGGIGSKNPNLGKQKVPSEEAVYPSYEPDPVTRPPAKKKLGQNKPRLSRGENLRGIAPAPASVEKTVVTRAKKEVYTAPLRIPSKLPKIVSGGPVPPKPKAVALVPGVKAASGDGPGPTPKSSMRESQIRDFKKYNKSNLLGRSIDDALRGFFSFMGTLPKSTDKDKWKNR